MIEDIPLIRRLEEEPLNDLVFLFSIRDCETVFLVIFIDDVKQNRVRLPMIEEVSSMSGDWTLTDLAIDQRTKSLLW